MNMLTDNDIDRLTSVLATKYEVQGLTEEIQKINKILGSLTNAIDGLAKVIDNLRVEYAAITTQLTRHEKWILQIAKKAKIKLDLAF